MLDKRHGERIKEVRKLKGYSQCGLAGIIGINVSYMNSMENGRWVITLPYFVKILNVLGWEYAQYILDPDSEVDIATLQLY